MSADRGYAESLAAALAGRAVDVPREPGDTRESVVVLADGRAPLLVRDFASSTRVILADGRSWTAPAGHVEAETVAAIEKATRGWAKSSADAPTFFELAFAVHRALEAELGDAWTVAFPGVVIPKEAWLHGPIFDAASVGVFDPPRAVVWIGSDARETVFAKRADLAPGLAAIASAVREQRARYARNTARAADLEPVVVALASRLSDRLGTTCTAHVAIRPTHASGLRMLVLRGREEIVRVTDEGGVVRAHAGLVGPDGWDGDLADLDRDVEAIVAALSVASQRLTLDKLTRGRRYRVLETIQKLHAGRVVRFRYYDDVDNHFGRYVFEDEHGKEVDVTGDFSSRHNPLAETHRFLEPAD